MSKGNNSDVFSYLRDHTDAHLVRDALHIVNGDDCDFIKIGKLQLLISAWEAQTLSESRIDGSGNILFSESRTTISTSQRVSTDSQGESQSLLEKVLPKQQRETQSQTQGVRQEQQSEGQRKV